MARYRLIVFTDAVPGQEAAYDAWYNDVHLADVADVPGVVSAQRFRLRTPMAGSFANQNLAIYEIDGDDPDQVIAAIEARGATGQMVISDSLDQSNMSVGVFEACSERVMAH